MTRLIFIEGVSGVGKSTVARALCEALRARGDSARCHLEGDAQNPVDLFCCAFLSPAAFALLLQNYPLDAARLTEHSIQESDYVLVRYGSVNAPFFEPPLVDVLREREGFYNPKNPIVPEQYTLVFADRWRRFLAPEQTRADYEVFDGSFLYHRANDLMHSYNASNEMIADHLMALLEAMAPQQPLLYYLSSQDVGARLCRARESRMQAPATAERIAFEIERKRRQTQILALLSVRTHFIDVSDENWPAALKRMIETLDGGELCL